jgi:hypothetical protein
MTLRVTSFKPRRPDTEDDFRAVNISAQGVYSFFAGCEEEIYPIKR